MLAKIKYFLQQSWLLMVSSVFFGLLLAATNTAWAPKIKENEANKFTNLARVLLPEAIRFEPISQAMVLDLGDGKPTPADVRKGFDADGRCVGWAFLCEGAGFADKIKLVVAVDAAFAKIAGFGVLSSNETPGFGDKINIAPKDGGFYQPQFIGAPVGPLTLTKTGDPKTIDAEIVAISGATVTSQSVVNILNTWLVPIKDKLAADGLLVP